MFTPYFYSNPSLAAESRDVHSYFLSVYVDGQNDPFLFWSGLIYFRIISLLMNSVFATHITQATAVLCID